MNRGENVGFDFSRYGAHINQVMWQILLQLHVSPSIWGLCYPWGWVTPKKLAFLGVLGLKKLSHPTVLIGLC